MFLYILIYTSSFVLRFLNSSAAFFSWGDNIFNDENELGVSHEEKSCNTNDLKLETGLITTMRQIWTADFMVTHNSHISSKKKPFQGALSEHGSDLHSWQILLSEPGSDLHQPIRPFCPNGPRPLGPKWHKFVRFCLKHLWELSGVLFWRATCNRSTCLLYRLSDVN